MRCRNPPLSLSLPLDGSATLCPGFCLNIWCFLWWNLYSFPNLTSLYDCQYFLDYSICAHLLHLHLQYLICARERRWSRPRPRDGSSRWPIFHSLHRVQGKNKQDTVIKAINDISRAANNWEIQLFWKNQEGLCWTSWEKVILGKLKHQHLHIVLQGNLNFVPANWRKNP